MQRSLDPYQFYKRVFLTARSGRFTANPPICLRIEHRPREDRVADKARRCLASEAAQKPHRRRTILPDEQVREQFRVPGVNRRPTRVGRGRDAKRLIGQPRARNGRVGRRRSSSCRRLHNREHAYRLMFFINMAPKVLRASLDCFYQRVVALSDDDLLLEVLRQGHAGRQQHTRVHARHRPSQMPAAGGHSVGNANRRQSRSAGVYLEQQVLPPLLPASLLAELRPASRRPPDD